MKMLRRIKLKALLSRKHYSSFGYHRYHKLVNDERHSNEDAHHHHHTHHHHLSLLKSLCKLSPLACMRTLSSSSATGGGGGGTCLGSSRKGYSMTSGGGGGGGGGGRRVPKDVHKGFCAVYVGPEHKRFVMKTCYLEHPVFGVLLRKSEEEFGFEYDGGLTIPCQVSVFEYVLRLIKQKHPSVDAMTKLLQSIE